jgi:antitoxin PrlF
MKKGAAKSGAFLIYGIISWRCHMAIETAQIGENGRIVIPAAYRKAMGLKPGEVVTIRMDEDGLHIQSKDQAIKRAQAAVSKYVSPGRSLSEELIAERRLEAKRESKRG